MFHKPATTLLIIATCLLTLAGCASTAQHQPLPTRPVSTYSIVARDGVTGKLGVAVQSHWFSVGTVVPWAEPGVGAVATQSLVDVSYGPLGLDLMRKGTSPKEALAILTAKDEGSAYRQVGMVSADGEVAAHTGDTCIAHASHITRTFPDGSAVSIQSNMMANPGVPEAMLEAVLAFKEAGTGSFEAMLVTSLAAAEIAGGDIRGRQSAALLVVDAEPAPNAWTGRLVDIRVEDHPTPVIELMRLLNVHNVYDHMNAGDLALERSDFDGAISEYREAIEGASGDRREEAAFWTGVTLASAGKPDESITYFQQAMSDPATAGNWAELLRRLPPAGLFPDNPELIERIITSSRPESATRGAE